MAWFKRYVALSGLISLALFVLIPLIGAIVFPDYGPQIGLYSGLCLIYFLLVVLILTYIGKRPEGYFDASSLE